MIGDIIKQLEPDFKETAEIKKILANIDKYLINDVRRGLLVIGGIGSGKTLLMRSMAIYGRNKGKPVEFVSMNELLLEYSHNGFKGLNRFLWNEHQEGFGYERYPQDLIIDDIGTEFGDANYYGTKINLIDNIISIRYEIFQKYGKLLHITTNLNTDLLKKKYDIRTTSRLKEMMYIIKYPKQDFRNNKYLKEIK